MFEMLDAFIGLIFVYLVLSLIVTTGMEFWTQSGGLRGKNLRLIIHRLLLNESGKEKDNELLSLFYEHPRIQTLKQNDKTNPSYIPKETCIDVMMDLVTQRVTKRDNINFAQFRKSPHKVERILELFEIKERDGNYAQLGKTLKSFWMDAGADVDTFQKKMEGWFEDTENRASGWFKRQVNIRLFIIGFTVAVLTNADTVHMFQILTTDDNLRKVYVEKALQVNQDQTLNLPCPTEDPDCNALDKAKLAAAEVSPLMGWDQPSLERFAPIINAVAPDTIKTKKTELDLPAILGALIGWLLTATALSLGAPFWYDMLQKVIRMRSSLRPGAGAQEPGTGAPGTPQAGIMTAQGIAVPAEPFDEENFALFKPNANSYNLVNAFWMVRFAELAYQNEKIVQARCKDWNLNAHFYSVETDTVDTQYFIAYNNDTAILSFRGTEADKMADVQTDADFRLTPCSWDKDLEVHTGFQRALDAAWPQITEQLDKYAKNRVLWIAGHSLGGALAALAAHRLDCEVEQNGKSLKIGGLYTCGQPRCGSYDFAEDLSERLGGRICRIVNNRDVVPLVPPPIGYAHAGPTLYINETGKLMYDPPFWYRVLDKMEVPTDPERLAKSLKESVGDHSARLYLSLLAKHLEA